jgi:hypothetical protein
MKTISCSERSARNMLELVYKVIDNTVSKKHLSGKKYQLREHMNNEIFFLYNMLETAPLCCGSQDTKKVQHIQYGR